MLGQKNKLITLRVLEKFAHGQIAKERRTQIAIPWVLSLLSGIHFSFNALIEEIEHSFTSEYALNCSQKSIISSLNRTITKERHFHAYFSRRRRSNFGRGD
jgi:hypothetical protein